MTFFFYASLSHASFLEIADQKTFPCVSQSLISKNESKKSKIILKNELEEICNILFKMLNSMSTIRTDVLRVLLSSLDVINLNTLYKQIGCTFKYNLENYTTEADPQKMVFIVFNILNKFSRKELNSMFSVVVQSDHLANSSDPLKSNICVLILMGLLDIFYKFPEFFTEVNFDVFKKALLNVQNNNLFGFNFMELLTIQKHVLKMVYIEQQSQQMISHIEIFFTSHFGNGKILNPSKKSQELIMSIFILLKEENLHTNLEKLYNSFIGKTNPITVY